MFAVGETAIFTVEATGDGLTYQWYYKTATGSSFKKSSSTSATYSTIVRDVHNGYQYYCVVTDSYGNSLETDIVTLTVGKKVAIVEQPVNGMFAVGETATFTVEATGDGLTYQWYYKTATGSSFKKSSATSTTYSTTVRSVHNGYQYYCVVTDSHGNSLETDIVTLTVGEKVAITEQPVDEMYAVGETATFTIGASGDGLNYQWYYKKPASSSFKAASSTSATYSFTVYNAHNGYQYYCVVTDSYGNSLESDTVTLTLGAKVKIIEQPVDGTYAVGDTATFTVGATGDGLTYQWYYKTATGSGFKKSSSTTETYSTVVRNVHNGYQYYCVVSDSYGNSLETNIVTLRIDTTIIINGITYEPVTDTTCRVASYSGTESSLVIPETVENYIVTEIGEEAFMNNSYLVSIDLPDTIEIIRARAFKNCVNLASMQ